MRYASSAVIIRYSRTSNGLEFLLCTSNQDFLRGKLVLPGGHVEDNETSLQAIVREIEEEVGLILKEEHLFNLPVADTPGRDPRGRVIDAPYFILLDADNFDQTPHAGDDIASCRWYNLDEVKPSMMAFDHSKIMSTAMVELYVAPVNHRVWTGFTVDDLLNIKGLIPGTV